MDFILDEMGADDWPEVCRIYLEGQATGTFEVGPPAWGPWDSGHHRHSRLVARRDGCVIGWAALAPVSARACYAGVAEVSLYVAADAQGKGVGKRLLQAVIESSERNGIWSLSGSTFPENRASLQVQMACGFRVVGRRERIARHHGVWRDTIITERRSRLVGTE